MIIYWQRVLWGIIITAASISGFFYVEYRTCTQDPGICAMNDSLYNYPLSLFTFIGAFMLLKSCKRKKKIYQAPPINNSQKK